MKRYFIACSILLATVFVFSFILVSNASSTTALNTVLQASSEEPISLIAPTNYVRPGDSITLVYSLYELICEEFSVDDSEIATVSDSGVVTGVSPGIVTVTLHAWDLSGQNVYEASVDIIVSNMTGLVDGTNYFLNNSLGTQTLLTISSSGTLFTDSLSGTSAPSFELDVWSDGRISFKYNTKAITVSNGSLTLANYTGAENQKFNIYRIWEGGSTGLYVIRYGTLYVGVNEDESLDLISHFCSTANLNCVEGIYWSLTKDVNGTATYIGIDCSYPGATLHTVENMGYFGNAFSDLGYTSQLLDTPSSATIFSALQNSSVYMYSGHANPGRLSPSNSSSGWQDRIYAHSSLGSSPYAISDLNDNALANAKYIVYVGCFTALEDNEFSLLEESFKKGAQAVYGSTHRIYALQTNSFVIHFSDAIKDPGGDYAYYATLMTCMSEAIVDLGLVPTLPLNAPKDAKKVYQYLPLICVGDDTQLVGLS